MAFASHMYVMIFKVVRYVSPLALLLHMVVRKLDHKDFRYHLSSNDNQTSIYISDVVSLKKNAWNDIKR